jgi:hypothetical protein
VSSFTVDAAAAERLFADITKRTADPNQDFALIQRYLAGDQRMPYMPQRAQLEFEEMAKRSISNWLPLVSDTFTKRLFVDGYRPTKEQDNSKPWDYWQANRLDARQTIVHRGALEYGEAYVLVLPGTKRGDKTPIIKPLSPLRSIAYYSDDDDEWPYLAAVQLNDRFDGAEVIEIYDDTNVYTFERQHEYTEPGANDGAGAPELVKPDWARTKIRKHGLGVVPFVRFRESLDDRTDGIIKPLIPDQERVNEVTFAIHMALQYGVFRQRYATGLTLPVDPQTGITISPFQIGANRLWVAEDEQVKFGEFGQVMISDHLNAYTKAVQTLAAHAQIDPNMLTGDVINVSSEALGSLQDSTTQRLNIYKMIFGESWEQVFRLAALAAGDKTSANDESSQTRWRDDTAHEFLTTVQGLATLVDKLKVPPEALWEKVPGTTNQDLTAWREAADKQANDPMATLLANIQKQATTPPLPPGQQPQPQPGQVAPPQQPQPGVTPNGATVTG